MRNVRDVQVTLTLRVFDEDVSTHVESAPLVQRTAVAWVAPDGAQHRLSALQYQKECQWLLAKLEADAIAAGGA